MMTESTYTWDLMRALESASPASCKTVLDIFFYSFFDFLMSWKNFFNSPKRSHTVFSSSLDFSSFLFLFNSLFFFGYISPFLFSFFNPFFNMHFLDLRIINLYRLLFKDRCFVSYCLMAFWVLSQGNFQLFFGLVCFEDNVEIAFQIKTAPFSRAIYLWEDIGINILKNALVAR